MLSDCSLLVAELDYQNSSAGCDAYEQAASIVVCNGFPKRSALVLYIP